MINKLHHIGALDRIFLDVGGFNQLVEFWIAIFAVIQLICARLEQIDKVFGIVEI